MEGDAPLECPIVGEFSGGAFKDGMDLLFGFDYLVIGKSCFFMTEPSSMTGHGAYVSSCYWDVDVGEQSFRVTLRHRPDAIQVRV